MVGKIKNYEFYDLFDKIEDLPTPLKAEGFFKALEQIYGIGPIIYSQLNGIVRTHDSCFLEGTYPQDWLSYYFEKKYFDSDPVAQRGLTCKSPFDWGDLPKDLPIVQQIFNDWADAGLGQKGLTIPLSTTSNITATLNISADLSNRDWRALRPCLLHGLSILGQYYHLKVCKKMQAITRTTAFGLQERELECLKWAASGKSIWETSVIMSQSERNVRYHLDQARRKLGCNTKIQAVAKAVALSLINIS